MMTKISRLMMKKVNARKRLIRLVSMPTALFSGCGISLKLSTGFAISGKV
jgi:hypothetical protein